MVDDARLRTVGRCVGRYVAASRDAVPDRPVLIGSGLDETNLTELLPLSNGAILGTALKVDRETENAVDPDRVRRIVKLAQSLA